MPGKDAPQFFRLELPQAYRRIPTAGRQQLAVRRETQTADSLLMARQDGPSLTCGDVQKCHSAIIVASSQGLPVGTEGYGVDRPRVAGDGQTASLGCNVPKLDRAVEA